MQNHPPIPTNLITGFLGVGKTTAIAHLLARKPAQEKWAVLVNEFGQVGIDGALLDDGEVAIRQVPGGCLCCVASQAFTVGLNRLIREYRPDRLLIEPSGLGHPARVLDTLGGPFYEQVLDLCATLCLVDPRHLTSTRHRENQNFQDQIALADILVANKADLCDEGVLRGFDAFAHGLRPTKRVLAHVDHGRLDPAWLDLPRLGIDNAAAASPHAHVEAIAIDGIAAPSAIDWQRSEGQADGWFSLGWIFSERHQFKTSALLKLLRAQDFARIKGVLPTDQGWQALNLIGQEGGFTPCANQAEGKLEILHPQALPADRLEQQIRATLIL